MKEVRILVTAAGGPTAIGILTCLQGLDNIEIIGVDCNKDTAANQFCHKTFVVSRLTSLQQYKEEIKSVVLRECIDVIFPTLHDEIMLYHEFKSELPCCVAIPESSYFESLIDKEALYKFLIGHGLSDFVPKHFGYQGRHELKKIIEENFQPDVNVCVKPSNSHGGLGFYILTNRNGYIKALQTEKKNILDRNIYYELELTHRGLVMECLEGTEYGVDILMAGGEIVACIPRTRSRVSNGVVIDGVVEQNHDIIVASKAICKELISDGFINLQFVTGPKGVKLIDLNARFCGSQVMSFGAGVNFPLLYINKIHLKQDVEIAPRWGTKMVRYWESVFFNKL